VERHEQQGVADDVRDDELQETEDDDAPPLWLVAWESQLITAPANTAANETSNQRPGFSMNARLTPPLGGLVAGRSGPPHNADTRTLPKVGEAKRAIEPPVGAKRDPGRAAFPEVPYKIRRSLGRSAQSG